MDIAAYSAREIYFLYWIQPVKCHVKLWLNQTFYYGDYLNKFHLLPSRIGSKLWTSELVFSCPVIWNVGKVWTKPFIDSAEDVCVGYLEFDLYLRFYFEYKNKLWTQIFKRERDCYRTVLNACPFVYLQGSVIERKMSCVTDSIYNCYKWCW